MKKNLMRGILILGIILLVGNLYSFDFESKGYLKYCGIVSNICLIISMILSLRDQKKQL